MTKILITLVVLALIGLIFYFIFKSLNPIEVNETYIKEKKTGKDSEVEFYKRTSANTDQEELDMEDDVHRPPKRPIIPKPEEQKEI